MDTTNEPFDVYNLGWTETDWQDANAEGWNIWHCDGSENGLWQICKYDEPELVDYVTDGKWETDPDVWLHVYTRAAQGSPLHQRAMDYVRIWNRPEWDSIVKWVDNRTPGL